MTAPRQVRPYGARSIAHPEATPSIRPPIQLRLVADPATRRVRRRARMLTALVGVVAGVGLFGIVVVHVLLAQGEVTVQQLQTKVQQESEQEQRLKVDVAQLESPARVVSTAEGKLGMVSPPTVVALSPASLDDPPATTIPAAPKATVTTLPSPAASTPTTAATSAVTSTAAAPTRP